MSSKTLIFDDFAVIFRSFLTKDIQCDINEEERLRGPIWAVWLDPARLVLGLSWVAKYDFPNGKWVAAGQGKKADAVVIISRTGTVIEQLADGRIMLVDSDESDYTIFVRQPNLDPKTVEGLFP